MSNEMLLQELTNDGNRYIDWTLIAALFANIIAFLALTKDLIIARFKNPLIDFYEVGSLSIYFGALGAGIEIMGTVRAIHEDQFVRALRVVITNNRDSSRHSFVWRSTRVPSMGPQGSTSTFVVPASFMVTPAQTSYIDAFMLDRETEKRLNEIELQVDQGWLETLESEFADIADTPAVAVDPFEPRAESVPSVVQAKSEAERVEEAFERFLETDQIRRIRTDIDRLCYWEEGGYSLTLDIVTARPDKTFSFSCAFNLTTDDEHRLRGGVEQILRAWCEVTVYPGLEPIRVDLQCTPASTSARTSDTARPG
jgi:hypothetical protein